MNRIHGVLVMILSTGCHQLAPVPTDQNMRPVSADSVPNVAQLLPFKTQQGLFEVTSTGRKQQLRSFRFIQEGSNWLYTIDRWQRRYLQRAQSGDIVTARIEQYSENVSVEYDPPLRILPTNLAVNVPYEGACKMRVVNLGTGAEQDHGRCEYRIEILGRKHFKTPAGLLEGYIVRTTQHIHLQLAKVHVVSDSAYVPNIGLVVERTHRKARALGLIAVEKAHQLRLVQ